MGRRLFEDLVVSGAGGQGSKGAAVPASALIHAALLGAVVIVPALTPGELPATPSPPFVLTLPVPPAPPPPPGNPPPTHRVARALAPPAAENHFVAPPVTPEAPPQPDEVDMTIGSGPVGTRCVGCVEGGLSNDNGTGLVGDDPVIPVVRPGFQGIRPPSKTRDVRPVYPELARLSGVEGIVIIECTIDPQGHVVGAQVLKGHPLLDAAAVDAVQQWRYTPTLLNGVPVSVVMTVTVQFRLRR